MNTRRRALAARATVFAILAASVVAACAPAGATPSPAQTRDSCAGDRIQRLVSDFLTDYNSGTAGLADRYFAAAPSFQWYSEPPSRLSGAAYDRTTLEAYLQGRHAEGDRLTLASLQPNAVKDNIGNFGFVVRRGVTDLQSKGAVDCGSGKFIVWSLGPNAGPVP